MLGGVYVKVRLAHATQPRACSQPNIRPEAQPVHLDLSLSPIITRLQNRASLSHLILTQCVSPQIPLEPLATIDAIDVARATNHQDTSPGSRGNHRIDSRTRLKKHASNNTVILKHIRRNRGEWWHQIWRFNHQRGRSWKR